MTEMTLPQFLNALAEAKREGKITMDPFHGFGGETQLRLNVAAPLTCLDGTVTDKSKYGFCPVAALASIRSGRFHSNSFFTTAGKAIGLDPSLSSTIARAADEYNDRAVGGSYTMSSLRTQLEAALKS